MVPISHGRDAFKMKRDELDRMDVRILATLQKNGRMTNVELAQTVGLSPSACLERVRRLEKQRIIMGYGAYLDVDRLGSNITIYVDITLKDQRPEDFERFERIIISMPEVLDCHRVSGGFDYVVKFLCRDTNSFRESMDRLLLADPGILKYASYVTLKRVKLSSKEIPIYTLKGETPPKGYV
jgi:DNA-binding Lrp family transcriptional regulator